MSTKDKPDVVVFAELNLAMESLVQVLLDIQPLYRHVAALRRLRMATAEDILQEAVKRLRNLLFINGRTIDKIECFQSEGGLDIGFTIAGPLQDGRRWMLDFSEYVMESPLPEVADIPERQSQSPLPKGPHSAAHSEQDLPFENRFQRVTRNTA